tara:strand:+ start:1982 stop:2731 length:750 start_codon:yes stop_codon:yes gene_type:complete
MRYLVIIICIFTANTLFSQKISNLKREVISSDIVLTFDIQPKFENRGTEERYVADVYVKELIKGYEEASLESFSRKQLNLPKSLVDDLKSGQNSIKIDAYDYLSEYLGSDTFLEFEVSITPSFIPSYFDNIGKLKIGKDNTINLNYWENANISYTLDKDGSILNRGQINKDKIISIPKSLKKGDYKLNLIVEALGNKNIYSREVEIIKGSPLPYLLLLLIGGGVYFVAMGGEKQKPNPPLPSPPLPPGG